MGRFLFLVLIAALLTGPSPAGAEEFEETEYRLKTAGIEPELRTAIHEAIRRAVRRLRSLQSRRGWVDGAVGRTALTALALRHAGTKEAIEGARRGLDALRTREKSPLVTSTYEAGIGAMLLDANRSDPDLGLRIHDKLAAGPGPSGYWGYVSSGRGGGGNLSTAQYAALGLWATERRGAPLAGDAWRKHLDALLRYQQEDGSWAYAAGVMTTLGPYSTYPTGTLMGFANLELASRALVAEIADDDRLLAEVVIGRAKAAAAPVVTPRDGPPPPDDTPRPPRLRLADRILDRFAEAHPRVGLLLMQRFATLDADGKFPRGAREGWHGAMLEAGGAQDFPQHKTAGDVDVNPNQILGWWQRHRRPDDEVWID